MGQDKFKAFRIQSTDGQIKGSLVSMGTSDLDEGDVIVKVHYSSINFKDALGATGKGKIYRKFPINGGIDASGVVEQSRHDDFAVGSKVLVTGCGLGETHDGGYAEYIRVPSQWLIPLPEQLSLREAMIIGTAGFTAALCIQRMEENRQSPELGSVLVTGASGGVGSLAVSMLKKRGYHVTGVSGKTDQHSYISALGADQILHPDEVNMETRPLESVKWGGAIDNLGGSMLQSILPKVALWGNVASVGLALDMELQSTVMPFILRGVSLLGISSANCPYDLRLQIWRRIATDLKPDALDQICCGELSLNDLTKGFQEIMDRKVVGRYLVHCLES